jgi:hypothetical protein
MQLAALISQNRARRGDPDLTICSPAHSQGRLIPRNSQHGDLSLNIDPRYTQSRQRQNRAIEAGHHVEDSGRWQTVVDSKSSKSVTGFAHQAIGRANP